MRIFSRHAAPKCSPHCVSFRNCPLSIFTAVSGGRLLASAEVEFGQAPPNSIDGLIAIERLLAQGLAT